MEETNIDLRNLRNAMIAMNDRIRRACLAVDDYAKGADKWWGIEKFAIEDVVRVRTIFDEDYVGVQLLLAYDEPTIWLCTEFNELRGWWGTETYTMQVPQEYTVKIESYYTLPF